MRARPNVFSIAPGLDFAATLVEAIMAGRLFPLAPPEDPFRLSDILIYVPTLRAAGLLRQAFISAAEGKAALLPEIRPLAEPGDPVEEMLSPPEDDAIAPDIGEPRPLSPLERAFHLRPGIAAWQEKLRSHRVEAGLSPPPVSLSETLSLADRLGRLIDEMAIEGRPLARLATVAPEEFDPSRFDDYWAMTREFLALAARDWPRILSDLGAEDENAARLARLRRQAERLLQRGSPRPVIVAGSTGSVRATAELMRAVALLDRGAVILPGLDHDLDEGAWRLIGQDKASLPTRFAHPQASLKRTLAILGVERAETGILGSADEPARARARFLSEAMRPAETSAQWRMARASLDLDNALAGLKLIEAVDEREEGRAIAVLMRQTLENPQARVALVTADRTLARRVAAELAAFGIDAADSAPGRLADRPAGILLRLALLSAREGRSASTLAFLRHPLSPLAHDDPVEMRIIDALEMFVARQFRFDPATSWSDRVRVACERGLASRWPWREPVSEADRAALAHLARRLDEYLAPFRPSAPSRGLQAHLEALLALLEPAREADAGDGGIEALRDAFAAFAEHLGQEQVSPHELQDLVAQALSVPAPARPADPGARAMILGMLEARLVHADRIILGGFNEGSVPPAVPGDPFLNRAMRLALDLQPGERRIGQSAHDVTMLLGGRDVVITRAGRVGTSPGIPSRFLRRMEAFAGQDLWRRKVKAPGDAFLRAIRDADAPGPRESLSQTAVIPQAPRLPPSVSITDFGRLRQDSYAVYARKILRLEPLGPLDPEPEASDRGTILHRILELYSASDPPSEREEALQFLRDIAAREFRPFAHEPEALQFWWKSFEDFAPEFIAFDQAARQEGRRIMVEVQAELSVLLPSGGMVRLTGKADRIEHAADASLHLCDFKSGEVPGWSKVRTGLEPQLPLSAALARRGAFRGVPGEAPIASLSYFGLGRKARKRLDRMPEADLGILPEQAWSEAIRLLDDLDQGRVAYLSKAVASKGRHEGDYDHLARVAEWQLGSEDDEDEGEP